MRYVGLCENYCLVIYKILSEIFACLKIFDEICKKVVHGDDFSDYYLTTIKCLNISVCPFYYLFPLTGNYIFRIKLIKLKNRNERSNF